ncbi:PREDICTED: keratin, type I cytoskeletal 10-like, partial [Rhagoletis zephyria]|uniref:keratin, type I cytoskeletal 10-like n=1 Tax=Rhagoletis zephyria TaxID=28612 RepID=UPI0008112CAF
MVQMMSRLVFGSFLLVHIVTASKYGSSSGGAGGGGGSGGGESIYLSSGGGSAGNVGGSSDGGSSLDLGSMFGMSDFAQSGPSYQSAGGASVPAAIQTKRTVEVKP